MAENTGRHEIWVEVDNTPPELAVNELTDNPTLDKPQYSINGTVETGAILIVNGIEISHNGTFEYTTNVIEGINAITVTATDAAGDTATWTKTRMVDTDLLPDYYEINVTGTDPLDGDSDSSLTPENEAANGITDDMETFGSDNLPALINMRIGTDPLKEDTDGDGLTDEFELLRLGLLTDPLSGTTNGIPDTVGEEMGRVVYDSANKITYDVLRAFNWPEYDGYHYEYRSDPWAVDIDGDGLEDEDELEAGTNPFKKDDPFLVEAVSGFVLGDIGLSNPKHDNTAYLGGSIASGLLPVVEWVATVRDVIANSWRGDWGTAGITLGAGLISAFPATVVADEVPEMAAKLGKFVRAYPGKITGVAKYPVGIGDVRNRPTNTY